MNQDDKRVCYTFEAALELAIDMENDSFRNYLAGVRMVKNQHAREILKEMALEELAHKQSLENALIIGAIDGEQSLQRPVPTMDLDYVLKPEELGPQAGVREAIAYAIHLEKQSLDFYRRMASGCEGAPMAKVFEQIGNDESRHLQKLEDMYEEHFLTEN